MKKNYNISILIFGLILSMVISQFLPINAVSVLADGSSDYVTSGYFKYKVEEDGTATILGLSKAISFTLDQFEIPSVIDGYQVKAIGDEAFSGVRFGSNCTVTIGDGIREIGKKAFYASGMKKVLIPKSVKEFGIWDYVFSYLYAEEIEVDPENDNLCSKDGVLFTKDLKTLYVYPVYKKEKTYIAPGETTTLACTSFGNTRIEKVYLPNNKVNFYTYTFFGCDVTVYACQERVDYWNSKKTNSWPAGNVTFAVLPEDMVIYEPIIPQSVTLNKSGHMFLENGATYQFTATLKPENATNQNIVWSSSDDSVVVVSQNGLALALKEGTAAIFCQGRGKFISFVLLYHRSYGIRYQRAAKKARRHVSVIQSKQRRAFL